MAMNRVSYSGLVLFYVLMTFATEALAGNLLFQVGDVMFTARPDDLICVRWKYLNGQPVVEIGLSKKASARLASITGKNISKQMRIIKDGRVLTSAVIMEPITEGVIVLSGGLSSSDVQAIARDLGERESGCTSKASPGSDSKR